MNTTWTCSLSRQKVCLPNHHLLMTWSIFLFSVGESKHAWRIETKSQVYSNHQSTLVHDLSPLLTISTTVTMVTMAPCSKQSPGLQWCIPSPHRPVVVHKGRQKHQRPATRKRRPFSPAFCFVGSCFILGLYGPKISSDFFRFGDNHNILGLTSILDIWSKSTLEMNERINSTSKWW